MLSNIKLKILFWAKVWVKLGQKWQQDWEMIKKENAEIKQKKSLGDYIIKKYLGLIDWAASNPAAKKKIAEPKEPAILLKALDGLVKHLNGGHLEDESEQNSGLSGILGLSKEKI